MLRSSMKSILLSHQIPFKRNRLLQVVIIAYAVFWVCMAIRPLDWKIWGMENSLLITLVIVLVWMYHKFRLSNLSYLLIAIFLTLHAYGGHFTYELTPVNDWLKAVFHIKRGFYDRIVHFMFGLLIAFPVRETVFRYLKQRSAKQYFVTFLIIVAAAGIFEILEMWSAVLFNPKLAKEYIGLEGDPFDSQKDMTMSLIGVLLSIPLFLLLNRAQKHAHKQA